MTKRNFHPRRKKAAGDDVVAWGTAAIFVTAAVRLLRAEYGWETEAAAGFGERLTAAAVELAQDMVALGKTPAGRMAAAGGTAQGAGDMSAAADLSTSADAAAG